MDERLGDAQRAAVAAGLDGLLVSPGADLRYLTGYHAHQLERLTLLVLPAEGPATLIVPRLERPAAEASGTTVTIVDHEDGGDPYPLVAAALGDTSQDGGNRALRSAPGLVPSDTPGKVPSDTPGKVLGLSNRMWAEQVLGLRVALPDAEQRLAGGVLAGLRLRKSAAEVAALRRAGAAIDAVHARMGEWLRAGRTEAEVATDIAVAIREAGHATVEFVIVASGPNGASPHHEVSDRVIQAGDPVVVDIGGAMPDGYCSDATRMYCVGRPPADFVEYYAVLRDAQEAAVAAVRPGITAHALDAVARDRIGAAGFGELFLHRTGHGIGLDGHEDPYIVAGNDQVLEEGMAFSIEPGIYAAGRHGARIEDIVVCTADGVERLNTRPTELEVL